MATQAQIAANRRNASKSTGPRTDRGRATSSQNARRHGLRGDVGDALLIEFLEVVRGNFGWEEGNIPASAINLAGAEARRFLVARASQDVQSEMQSPSQLQMQLTALMREMLADGRSMEVFDVALRHISLTEERVLRRDLAERYLSEAEANVSRKRRALADELASDYSGSHYLGPR